MVDPMFSPILVTFLGLSEHVGVSPKSVLDDHGVLSHFTSCSLPKKISNFYRYLNRCHQTWPALAEDPVYIMAGVSSLGDPPTRSHKKYPVPIAG